MEYEISRAITLRRGRTDIVEGYIAWFSTRVRNAEGERKHPKPDPGCWSGLLTALIDRTAAALSLCTPEERQTGLHWLYDCKECSWCALHLEVAAQLEEGPIWDKLLEKAVKIMRKYLTSPRFDYDISRHITLCLNALEARFGPQAERELLKRLVSWDAFEDATEPAIRDCNYKKWHDAQLRAKWQI